MDQVYNTDENQVVINHENNGIDIEELQPTADARAAAEAHPNKDLLALPRSEILAAQSGSTEVTDSAVKKVAGKVLRRASLMSAAIRPKELTDEEKADRLKKLEDEAWCRKEQVF